jgi:ATP-dependent DNA helicase RecG
MPLPTIEENGGGVMAVVLRKIMCGNTAERSGDVGVNVGVMSV